MFSYASLLSEIDTDGKLKVAKVTTTECPVFGVGVEAHCHADLRKGLRLLGKAGFIECSNQFFHFGDDLLLMGLQRLSA